jgi:hypothetical protein
MADATHGLAACPEVTIPGFPKNATEHVAAAVQEYKGKCSAHLRVYMRSADDETEFVPTRKGLTLPLDKVGELRDGVRLLRDVAATNRVVAVIDDGREQVRVGVHTFKGNLYAYVRRHYKSGGEWKPSPKGLDVRAELVDDLVDLVEELASAVKQPG